MKGFRLARLLRLKEEHANLKRLAWAVSERDVASAAMNVNGSKSRLAAGEEALRQGLVDRRSRGEVQAVLSGHRALDAQRADIEVQKARLEESRAVAHEKQLESQAAKREVEGLLRLEQRWLKEEKARARRRAARASDEYISSKVSMEFARAARQEPIEESEISDTRD